METHCNPLLQANICPSPHTLSIPRARGGAVVVERLAVHLLAIHGDHAISMVHFLQKGQLALKT